MEDSRSAAFLRSRKYGERFLAGETRQHAMDHGASV
jgi:hypothetical protein